MSKTKSSSAGGLVIAVIAVLLFWPKKSTGGNGDSTGNLSLEIIPGTSGMSQPLRRSRFGRMRQARMGGVTGPLTEGSTGNIARLTVKNTSTKLGQSVAYTFGITGVIKVADYEVLNINAQSIMSASETVIKSYLFDIPVGRFGNGFATAVLRDTKGSQIASTDVNFTVTEAPIVPGGTITW